MSGESWQSSGFDSHELYTRATDGHGHKDVIRVSLPPYLLNRVNAFVGDAKVLGYAGTQDFIRDAIVHRLEFWSNDLPGPSRLAWRTTLAMMRVDKRMAELEAITALTARYKDAMEQCARNEWRAELVELLDECETQARDMIDEGKAGAGVLVDLAGYFRNELARMRVSK